MSKNRFQRVFLPSQSLDTVSPSDMLFCFELLSKDLAKERVLLIKVHQVRNNRFFGFPLHDGPAQKLK